MLLPKTERFRSPEDFARVVELLDKTIEGEPRRRKLLDDALDIILDALRLAPVGLAAVAWDASQHAPLDLNKMLQRRRELDAAIKSYRGTE